MSASLDSQSLGRLTAEEQDSQAKLPERSPQENQLEQPLQEHEQMQEDKLRSVDTEQQDRQQQSQPQLQIQKDLGTAIMAPQAKDTNNILRRRNVYISGLPESYRAADFREMCQSFGRVEASKLCMDNKSRPTKSYGFALFFKETDAAECIRALNGQWWGGQLLQARLADAAATPVPLDPVSAHPPLVRTRPYGKSHRTPNSSVHSGSGIYDGPLMLPKSGQLSISPTSSQDVTPPMTPQQLCLTPTIVPQGNQNLNTNVGATGGGPLQSVFYQTSPLDQQVGCQMATFPQQHSYVQVPPHYVQTPMMGMPVYFTVPQQPSVSGGAGVAPQFVVPSTMVAQGGYPQQVYSQIMFSQ